jgi:16S rRNA (guanine527-N7)-methyltransferase
MTVSGLRQQLIAGCRLLPTGEPTSAEIDLLLAYQDLLSHWNKTYNLTAIRAAGEMVSRHLLDSLSVLPWIADGPLLDAGTGAGLPGIPLAIMRPELEVTLLDSVGKKVRFLRHVKRELAIENIHPVQQRLESFDTEVVFSSIISRAFSSLAGFAGASRHLISSETKLLAMKGQSPDDEILDLPGWLKLDRLEKLDVPALHEQRHLVIMSLTT